MPSIIGGIYYKPQNNTPTDIFGNAIDLQTLTVREHDPIHSEWMYNAYEPRYSKIFSNTEDTKSPAITEVQEQSPAPSAQTPAIESETIKSPSTTVASVTPMSTSSPASTSIKTGTPKTTLSRETSNMSKWWMDQFAKLGVSSNQQIAIVSAMLSECGLKPKGSVNKKEFEGKGNTEAGWAGAGEGAVGFTHWDLKKKMIDLYNADPRRKGPKLSNIKSEYIKNDSRHIADLDDEDHALMTYLYYKPLLDRTKNMNFDDTVAEFYLQKAGRGYAKDAKKDATSYEKAVHVGEKYQKFHANQGYTKASKTNTFLKSLDYARNLASQLGQSDQVSSQTTPVVQTPVKNSSSSKHVFKHKNMNVGHMQSLLDEASKYGISFRVTSGLRPGAKTKSGNVSWHASGHAIDVTPIAGQTYDDLRQAIRNNPAFVKWMQDRGYGIYEETTPDVMSKTGATGMHWHIGKDKVAIKGLQKIIS